MTSCEYATISKFGVSAGNSPQNDPMTYIALSGLESGFLHTIGSGTSLLGPNSGQAQRAAAQICSLKWNGTCEYLANDQNKIYPNMVSSCNGNNGSCMGPGLGNALTHGQILIRNTAAEKYLTHMSDNCVRVYEPFDPTVAASPMISNWVPNGNNCAGPGHCNQSNVCIPIYDVDAKTIDNDPVMNKILAQPYIAMDILGNIYNNRKRTNRLRELQNTKIGRFFANTGFQQIVAEKMVRP